MLDLEAIHPPPPPLDFTFEQKVVLNHLCLYNQKGFGANRVTVKSWRIVIFLTCCFVISACLILFPNRVPPFFGTLLSGFFAGSLLTATRYRLAFQRQWPLLKSIIDWKLADRVRREAGLPDDHDA